MRRPYIGVNGFMNMADVLTALNSLPENGYRSLMVGVLASSKTLNGHTNSLPNRFPDVRNIHKIFVRDPRALNLIHYATDNEGYLAAELVQMSEYGGLNMNGFQLNITWPSQYSILRLHETCGKKFIVLQIGRRAFEMMDNSPELIADNVADYGDSIDHVLLDLSGGHGKPLDALQLRSYLDAIKSRVPRIGLGVAGGLSPNTLELIQPLVEDFRDLSIDAEGRLRTPEDHLDLAVAGDYIKKAYQIFGRR